MDTKAIREALANFSRENEEEYYGLDKDSARELIFTTEQLLDENTRLIADKEAAEISIKAWKSLEFDFETLKGNYQQLLGLYQELREVKRRVAESNDSNYARSCEYAGQIKQLQADKAAAVEALKDIVDNSDDQGAIDCASQALERIESGEKG